MPFTKKCSFARNQVVGNFTALGTAVLPLFESFRRSEDPIAKARTDDIVGSLWLDVRSEIGADRRMANFVDPR